MRPAKPPSNVSTPIPQGLSLVQLILSISQSCSAQGRALPLSVASSGSPRRSDWLDNIFAFDPGRLDLKIAGHRDVERSEIIPAAQALGFKVSEHMCLLAPPRPHRPAEAR